jgi:hypothetical protein
MTLYSSDKVHSDLTKSSSACFEMNLPANPNTTGLADLTRLSCSLVFVNDSN